jgi:predicted component of type VI protein secretion system
MFGRIRMYIQNDEELIDSVIDSDEFKKAESINEVSRIVRRALRKRLIDIHIDDSVDIRERERIVNRHMEWITIKILRELDGIVMMPDHFDEIDELESAWRKFQGC